MLLACFTTDFRKCLTSLITKLCRTNANIITFFFSAKLLLKNFYLLPKNFHILLKNFYI